MSSKSEAYKTFTELARPILDDPNFQSMKQYVQHGKVTTYEHCMDVAWTAFCLNRRLHLGVKESELVTACLLHDYYLYDWHTHGDHLHGFHHPAIAADAYVAADAVGYPEQQDCVAAYDLRQDLLYK